MFQGNFSYALKKTKMIGNQINGMKVWHEKDKTRQFVPNIKGSYEALWFHKF